MHFVRFFVLGHLVCRSFHTTVALDIAKEHLYFARERLEILMARRCRSKNV